MRSSHTYSDPCRGLLLSDSLAAPDPEGLDTFTYGPPRPASQPRSDPKTPRRAGLPGPLERHEVRLDGRPQPPADARAGVGTVAAARRRSRRRLNTSGA